MPTAQSFEQVQPSRTSVEPSSNARPLFQPTGLVLWCGDQRVRVGDADKVVLLDDVSSAAMKWLHDLDGTRTWATVLAQGIEPDALRLFRYAWQLGCIDDAAIRPGSWWRTPGVARDGEAQRRALLHHLGSAASAHDHLEHRRAQRIAVVGAGTLASQAIAVARRSQLQVGWLRAADEQLPDDTAFCVIADGGHPDLTGSPDHLAFQVPHLVVRAFGMRAMVGPVVIPGQTSCLTCTHLHSLDTQPGWAQVAVQLAAMTQAQNTHCLDPLLARMASSHAILLARTVIDAPDTAATILGNRAFLWSASHAQPQEVGRPGHPLCGCRWSDLSE